MPDTKKLTIHDRFEYPDVDSAALPKDTLGIYQEDPTLCGARSPKREWSCTAGYTHQPPHVATSGGIILAVWEEGDE